MLGRSFFLPFPRFVKLVLVLEELESASDTVHCRSLQVLLHVVVAEVSRSIELRAIALKRWPVFPALIQARRRFTGFDVRFEGRVDVFVGKLPLGYIP